MMMMMVLDDVCVIMTDSSKRGKGRSIYPFFFQRKCSSKDYGLMRLYCLLKFGLRECFFLTLE